MDSATTVAYTIRIHNDPDGLWAEVVELPGVFATGDDLEELFECLEEGIGMYLSDDDKTVTAHRVEADGDIVESRREFELTNA